MRHVLLNKGLLVFFACLQCTLLGGLVYGWASVAGTLLVAPETAGGAELTVEETTTIFSAAASVSSFSSLLLGLILDSFGPRACSLLSHITIAVGCQLFAVAENFAHFNFAACLIAFGGPGIISSVVHIANLFEHSQFLVMSSVTGSMTLSFLVLPIFGVLWQHFGIGFRPMFASYVFVAILSSIASLVLWPDKPFEKASVESNLPLLKEDGPLDVSYEDEVVEATVEHHKLFEQPLNSYLRRNSHHQLDRKESFIVSVQAVQQGHEALVSLKDQPFGRQLASLVYWRSIVVFVCTVFFANFYIASLPIELADTILFSDAQRNRLANAFTLIMSCGTPVSFATGWLMDQVGLEACTGITLTMGILQMLSVSVVCRSELMMLVAFTFYTMFRNSLFPIFIASISSKLGFKYFGLLSGLGYALSGVAQLFMADLVRSAQGTCHVAASDNCDSGSWIELHVVQLCFLCVLGFVPLWDYRSRVRRDQDVIQVGTPTVSSSYGSIDTFHGVSLGSDIEALEADSSFG